MTSPRDMREPTKGPWHISGNDNGPGERFLHIGAMNSPMVLASMNPVHTHTVANARLIAAAPELLAALQAIADNSNEENEWDAVELLRENEATARAAIAKARGQA